MNVTIAVASRRFANREALALVQLLFPLLHRALGTMRKIIEMVVRPIALAPLKPRIRLEDIEGAAALAGHQSHPGWMETATAK
jgi:hypothetical protein